MLSRIRAWLREHFIGVASILLVSLFFVVLFAPYIFVTVPPGHAGVLWLRFFGGTVINFEYGEGTKMIFPWDKIYVYDQRLHYVTEDYDVLAQDGLQLRMNILTRYRLNPELVALLHKAIGPDYVSRLLVPQVGASARQEMSSYSPEDLYTRKREEVQQRILADVKEGLAVIDDGNPVGELLVNVYDVLVRSVTLPAAVLSAIELKVIQGQRDQQYTYILSQERQEADRKRIEAEGIKGFQDIVKSSITPQYLAWKGIDATLRLAESENAKVVIVGGDKSGLPIILGDEFARVHEAPRPEKEVAGELRESPTSSNPKTMSEGVPITRSVLDRTLSSEDPKSPKSAADAEHSAGPNKPGQRSSSATRPRKNEGEGRVKK